MAKQDLVVKLLLDSGAFGQDIREAERKTQEFKNGMEGAAGKVGDFGREIGISAGALGKLGGLLTGAGGVVAAVGAFRSVMDSSYDSSRKLRGQIAGFESVIDNFQRSIATFDWSNWRSGLDDVYRAGKEAEQAMIDANRAATAHGLVKSTGLNKITGLEYLFDTAKTEAEANLYKEQALNEIRDLKRKTENLGDLVDDEFIKTVRNMDSGKLKMEFITAEDATKWLNEAADYILADKSPDDPDYGKKTQDMRDYNRISQFIKDVDYVEKKGRRAVREEEEKSAKWGDQTSMAYNKDMADAAQKKADYYKSILDNLDENIAKRDNLISENQGLFFRNAIYKMPEDVYNEMVEPRITASDELESIRAKELEIEKWEWSDKTSTGGSTGGTSGGSTGGSDIIIPNPLIEAELRKAIKQQEQLKAEAELGSEAWWKATNALAEYTKQLEKLLLSEAKLKHPMEPLPEISNILPPQKIEAPEMGLAVPKGYKREGGLIVKDVKTPDINVGKIVDELNNMNSALSSSIMLVNGLGAAFASCEDETAQQLAGMTDIVSSVMSGIVGLMQIQQSAIATNNAYALSVATGQAASLPFPANIAAIATVVGTIMSVFATIKQMSNNKFAEGGIVGGTSYSGDKLFAMVNSGEMILNKRQQRNLGNMLGGGGNQVEFHISGDSLVGVLNNKQRKQNLIR